MEKKENGTVFLGGTITTKNLSLYRHALQIAQELNISTTNTETSNKKSEILQLSTELPQHHGQVLDALNKADFLFGDFTYAHPYALHELMYMLGQKKFALYALARNATSQLRIIDLFPGQTVSLMYNSSSEKVDRDQLKSKFQTIQRQLTNWSGNDKIIRTGDLVLNLSTKTATLNGRELSKITPFQFSILTMLGERLHQIVNMDEIIKELHLDSSPNFSRTTTRHTISREIGHINDSFQDLRYLEIFRLIGYRLNDLNVINRYAPSGRLHHNGLTVDLISGNIGIDDKQIPVTSRIRRFLTFLMINKGKTVSEQEIQQFVWGENTGIVPDKKSNRSSRSMLADTRNILDPYKNNITASLISTIPNKGLIMPLE